MSHCLHRRAAALALGLPLLAAAQGRADPAAAPALAPAPARALAYSSAFADYQPFQNIPPGDWRRLNDHVGRAALPQGARAPEAGTQPATPAAQAPAAPPPAARMPMPHGTGQHPHHAHHPHHPHSHGGRP